MDETILKSGMATICKLGGRFGNSCIMPDEATYVNHGLGIDARKGIKEAMDSQLDPEFKKAASIASAASGSTDKALIPLWVEPNIVDLTRRLTPLVELTPRVTNYTNVASYNRLTARGVTGWLFEDAALTESTDTYERVTVNVKYQYQVGRVTGPFQAASRNYLGANYIDALNLEIMNKTKTARFIEEDTIINGNATTSHAGYGSVTAPNTAEFNGILNQTSIQTTAAGSVPIDIITLRSAIRKARNANESATLGQGNPDMIVTDYKTQDDLKALLQDYQRIVPNAQIAWGFQSMIFEGLPIIPSRFAPTTTNGKIMAIMDSSTWQMRVLQDLTYEELAKTNDSYKFMIKLYETLICTAPEYNCTITGLA